MINSLTVLFCNVNVHSVRHIARIIDIRSLPCAIFWWKYRDILKNYSKYDSTDEHSGINYEVENRAKMHECYVDCQFKNLNDD